MERLLVRSRWLGLSWDPTRPDGRSGRYHTETRSAELNGREGSPVMAWWANHPAAMLVVKPLADLGYILPSWRLWSQPVMPPHSCRA
jgi:hypothetical protein